MGSGDFIQDRLKGMRNRRQITPRGCAGAKRWLSLRAKALQGGEKAIAEMRVIDLRLGERGAHLVQQVLVEGATAGEITHRAGKDGRNGSRAHRGTSRLIETALETLADHFGIAGGVGGGSRARKILPGEKPTREVVDPADPKRTVTVEYSTKDDVLGAMLANGVIDQRQFDAGRRWQAAHGITEVGARPNRWATPVDGGNADYFGSKKEREYAAVELANIRDLLTPWHHQLLRRVLGTSPELCDLVRPGRVVDGRVRVVDEVKEFKAVLSRLAEVYASWGDCDRPGSSWAA